MTAARRRAVLIAGGSLLAAAELWAPAFRSLQATGFGDWQLFHHMWEAGFVALTRYHEWPLWDPYHCGGITILGNPESQHLSPLYLLLALLAEPTLGSKLFLLVHAWAGFAGMYLLARRSYGLGVPGAVLASLAWAASGFFVSHGSGGHITFLPFYLTPWVLLSWRAAARDSRYAAAVAGLLALTLAEGGVYPFPYLLLLLAFDTALRALEGERPRNLLRAGLWVLPLTAMLGAIRLLPIADELDRSPRTTRNVDGVSLREVLEMLTARQHAWRYTGHDFVWPEYATYVGYGVLCLAAVGCLRAWRKPWPGAAAGLLVFLGLMMGFHGPASPWSLVHHLPIYDSLRVPSRFAVFFTFYLALLAGRGLDVTAAWLQPPSAGVWLKRIGIALPYVAIAAIAFDMRKVHRPTLDRWTEPPVITDRVSPRYYLSPLPYGTYYASFPRMNLGSAGCYEGMTFTPARGLWTGDRPQARLLQGAGTVSGFGRTTSRAWVDVTLKGAGAVLFDQNYDRDWESSAGSVVDHFGMLAVELPAGTYHLTLRYLPRTLLPGAILSLLGALLALALATGRLPRLKRRGPWSQSRPGPRSSS